MATAIARLLAAFLVVGLAQSFILSGSSSFSIRLRPSALELNVVSPPLSSAGRDPTESESESEPGKFQVDYKAYSKGFKTVFNELQFASCKPSSGALPDDLVGTYFRNGPAMFSAGSILPPKTSIIQPRDGPPVPDGQNTKRMVVHPFEADGGILAVTFGCAPPDGDDSSSQGGDQTDEEIKEKDHPSIVARYRYVRTVAFTNERRKGQRLYRAMDSTRELGPTVGVGLGNDITTAPLFRHHLLPGLNKFRKNTSNTRAIYWGKRLMSMWEGGLPYKMDALALSTEGRSQLGGVVKEQDPFGAKMVYDPIQNRAIMYGVGQFGKQSEITIYEFDDKFRLVPEQGGKVKESLPGMAMISDLAATQNFSVFIQPSVSVGLQFLVVREPGKILNVESKPAVVHLIPRVGSKRRGTSIQIPFDGVVEANLQLINAYEQGDGDIVVLDAIRSDASHKNKNGPKLGEWPWVSTEAEYVNNASKTSLWRYTINVKLNSVTKELLSNQQCTLAVINPSRSTQPHRYIYMAIGALGETIAPPQGIAQFDTATRSLKSWIPQAHEFCGEPMFADKKGTPLDAAEDDGYIMSALFNGKTEQSEMVIFQASDISAGPIARIPLGIGIPHGLHGCWSSAPETNWSAVSIERRAKLSDKMESRGNMWNEVKSDFSGLGLRLDDMEEYFGDSFLS